jgi:hypothetical protein
LACTSIVTSWILSSILAILGWPVCSSSSKLSLTYSKWLFHLNTILRPEPSSLYTCLIIWNILLTDLPNFWQKLTFSCCSKCDILNFHCLPTTTPYSSDFLSEYTACTGLHLAGMREEWTRRHLMAPRIRCSA